MSENDIGRKRANWENFRASIANTISLPTRLRRMVMSAAGTLSGRPAYRWTRSRVASAVKSTISKRYLYVVDLLLSAIALVLAMWLRLGPQMFLTDIAKPPVCRHPSWPCSS